MEKLRREQIKNQEEVCIWHKRLGHILYESMEKMKKGPECDVRTKGERVYCKVCILAKKTKAPINGKLAEDAEAIFLHIDVCGPLQMQSGIRLLSVSCTYKKNKVCGLTV